MKVSCVIPTHDRLELLQLAIWSAIGQTWRPLEIVVVDDGDQSAEELVASIAKQSQTDIRYLRKRTGPFGASSSRNFGASVAKGELLAFLDDDDFWLPYHLESAISTMTSDGSQLCIGGLVHLAGEDFVNGPHMQSGLIASDVLAKNPGMTGSNFVVSANTFRSIDGFDQGLPVSNDKDLLVRLLQELGNYSVTRDRTVVYRQHDGPKLTQWDSRRARGLRLYREKWDVDLSRDQRRFLQRQIVSCERRSATGYERLKLTYLLLRLTSPPEILRQGLGRVGILNF
ncbi:glycosyltransferase family 2 protein [Rhodococcoides fascians A25f]|uniref:glycosyltransferase family 2 protein n=1 Tax=Rhodococcoides fascians TaxID=1828 RepID=UPI00055E9BE6|nr:glycosyltransferase family 2 protein [Rhodococcus fascians]QII08114.1 glycosyltransferase family 2 protein [Rhodococcus fascians A25f]